MMRNVTEVQRRLIELKYLAPLAPDGTRNDDGTFGPISLSAYNHFRATKGRPPVGGVSMEELNADLFPDDYQTRKVTPMNTTTVDVISAWMSTKNWAAAFAVITTILHLFGINIPGDLGPVIQQVAVALAALYVIVKNTWFTTTVTAASAKKL